MTNLLWDVRPLCADDWQLVRDARLEALHDSPQAFLAQRDHEEVWDESDWRRTFLAACWLAVVEVEVDVIGLLRSFRDREEPWACELQAVWVARPFRKRGVFRSMLAHVTEHERAAEACLLRLWVLDDNHDAQQVYERLGFVLTGDRQPLPGTTDRFEVRMCRALTS